MNMFRHALTVSALGLFTLLASVYPGPSALAQSKPAAPLTNSPSTTQPKPKFPEPRVRENVTQDRAVRIQEQQVRGATTSIQVQPLHGGAAYNVVPPSISSSTDPAHMEGQAQWKVFTFK
ncbi:MAG TPA: hypothetical protein PLD03_07155 [Thiomonas arsenitoxydans]|jgi:hypothetical protein|nr:hypothetical protein [Thiomonas sp.]OZB72077.1 MAG: hypothetical protein B7X36_12385 [Thiomonas sp. 14-64-326]HOI66367.1 hypothetical protein [Thiomonas arsenitoxydans]